MDFNRTFSTDLNQNKISLLIETTTVDEDQNCYQNNSGSLLAWNETVGFLDEILTE